MDAVGRGGDNRETMMFIAILPNTSGINSDNGGYTCVFVCEMGGARWWQKWRAQGGRCSIAKCKSYSEQKLMSLIDVQIASKKLKMNYTCVC